MIRVPKGVDPRRVNTFVAARRALFDACLDEFAEHLASGHTISAAARRAGCSAGLAPALLEYLCEVVGREQAR